MRFIVTLVSLILIFSVSAKTSFLPSEDDEFPAIGNEFVNFLPAPRIVGGKYAVDGQFPYQVLLLADSYYCGGSIISNQYVVTAAHCVARWVPGRVFTTSPSKITIRAGSTKFFSDGVTVGVSNVTVYPEYTANSHDIALLKLSAPLTFTDRIKAIPLIATEVPNKSNVLISGWGINRRGGPIPTHLQYNTVKVVSDEQCAKLIGSIDESILCLGNQRGIGICQGDSGGPAVYDGQLVGVTSFVAGGCGSIYPDGFAKISFFHNWIKENSDL